VPPTHTANDPATAGGAPRRHLHLRAAGVSLVAQIDHRALPRIVHWGADLGRLDENALDELASAAVRPATPNALEGATQTAVLPEHSAGWSGLPGLSGHRAGRAWSTRFIVTKAHVDQRAADQGGTLTVDARDDEAALSLRLVLELLPSGVLRTCATVRNEQASVDGEAPFVVDGLVLALPLPPVATEILDFAGRHNRERAPQRSALTVGAHVRDSRRGRTGADASLVLAAGSSGFDTRAGEVWGIHVGWSGNHRSYVEQVASGARVIGGGELLLPGEVRLGRGEEYGTPWLYGSFGHGLDEVAARFHRHLRTRSTHPRSHRPVVLNTWEAVYFDHRLDRLTQLAKLGAEVGVERFVLDDGWFRHRRDDTAGLGDWYVDEKVWPDGLTPLIDEVHRLGMDFGLWVEPEMVNPDSDLARAHPDWILATGGRQPLSWRSQQVLDLTNPHAYAYILERLDALLSEYDIAFLKWDHNRDLIEAGRPPGGEAGVHQQTLAIYRLLDELRAKHPGVEIESCSSGGARADLGVLERTDRIWASDCIDALERQQIQRWTSQLLPLELIGAHVGAPRSHTTGRAHTLAFRAGTALFGSFGIEWDLTTASAEELEELARWVALYKDKRHLLHSGVLVRSAQHDPSMAVHGVVADDRSEALFALVRLATGLTTVPGPVRVPGLDPDRRYRVEPQSPGDRPGISEHAAAPWQARGGVTLTGRALGEVGVQAPSLDPEQLLLLSVREV
jgi:alpha-galactosidase